MSINLKITTGFYFRTGTKPTKNWFTTFRYATVSISSEKYTWGKNAQRYGRSSGMLKESVVQLEAIFRVEIFKRIFVRTVQQKFQTLQFLKQAKK